MIIYKKTLEIEKKTNIIKHIINDPNDEYLIFEFLNCKYIKMKLIVVCLDMVYIKIHINKYHHIY